MNRNQNLAPRPQSRLESIRLGVLVAIHLGRREVLQPEADRGRGERGGQDVASAAVGTWRAQRASDVDETYVSSAMIGWQEVATLASALPG